MSSNNEKDLPSDAADTLSGVEEVVIDEIDDADETVPPEFRGCKVVELRTDNGSVLLYKGKSGFTASEEQAKILIQAYRLEKESEAEAALNGPESRPGGHPGRVSSVETPIPGDLVLRVLGYGADVPEKLQGSRLIQRGEQRFYLTLDGEAIPEDVGQDLLDTWEFEHPMDASVGQGEGAASDDDVLLDGEPTVTDGGEELRARVLELAARQTGLGDVEVSSAVLDNAQGTPDEQDEMDESAAGGLAGGAGPGTGAEDSPMLRADVDDRSDVSIEDVGESSDGAATDQDGGKGHSLGGLLPFSETSTRPPQPALQSRPGAAIDNSGKLGQDNEPGQIDPAGALKGLAGLRSTGQTAGAVAHGEQGASQDDRGAGSSDPPSSGTETIGDGKDPDQAGSAVASDSPAESRPSPVSGVEGEALVYSAEELTRAEQELSEAADLLRRDLATSVLKLDELSPALDEIREAFWKALGSASDRHLERFVRRSLEMSEEVASLWRDSKDRRHQSWLQDMESGTLVLCAVNPLQAAQTDFLALVTLVRMRAKPDAFESRVHRTLDRLKRELSSRLSRDLVSKSVMQAMPAFVIGMMKEGRSKSAAVEAWLQSRLSDAVTAVVMQMRESEGISVPGLVEHLLDTYGAMVEGLARHLATPPGK